MKRGLSNATYAELMRGMPAPTDDFPCSRVWADAGPPSQIESIRKQGKAGPLVPYVVVAGNFAVLEWYGAGGGKALLYFSNGRWNTIVRGGGDLSTDVARKHGVPESAWCPFGIPDAKCPPKN